MATRLFKMNNPYFSIVIPTYRRRQLLRRALQSALAQSFTSYEIIVVNNDSGASLDRVVDEPGEQRIRYFDYWEKQGASGARNMGVAAARGSYICFLDDDDEYFPDLLTEVHQFIASNSKLQNDFIWCGVEKLYYHGDELVKKSIYKIETRSVQDKTYVLRIGTGCGLCVKTDAIRAVGGFDESMTVSEDRDLILKLLEQNFQGAALNKILYSRYYHEGERLSSSLQHRENARHDQLLLDKHDRYLGQHPALAQKLLDQLAQNYFLAGDTHKALQTAWKNWKIGPLRHKATRRLIRYLAHRLIKPKSDRAQEDS